MEGTYHARGGSCGSGTDHDISDFVAPVRLAFLVGQQRKGSLLQFVCAVLVWERPNAEEVVSRNGDKRLFQ